MAAAVLRWGCLGLRPTTYGCLRNATMLVHAHAVLKGQCYVCVVWYEESWGTWGLFGSVYCHHLLIKVVTLA